MTTPTKPGQRCRIIGSWSTDDQGVRGPNHHKEVTTLFLHDEKADDRVPVWRVQGTNLVSSFGAAGSQVDCLEYWLEVIDETPAPDKVDERETELV